MKKLIIVLLVLILTLSCIPAVTASDPSDPCADGHNIVAKDAREATCTMMGYSFHYECSRCGFIPSTATVSAQLFRTFTTILIDLSKAISSSASPAEGHVIFKVGDEGQGSGSSGTGTGVAPVDPGTPGVAPVDPGTSGTAPVDPGTPGVAPFDPGTYPYSPGIFGHEPEFTAQCLTNVVAAISRCLDDDIDEFFAAEYVFEEEVNSALSKMTDVIEGKTVMPPLLEEYIEAQTAPFYEFEVERSNPITLYPALGHDFEGDFRIVRQPTVSEIGYKYIGCTRCPEIESVDVEYLPSDANGDGKVNSKDISLIKRYCAGAVSEDDVVIVNCDMTGDGKVTSKDIALVKRAVAGA